MKKDKRNLFLTVLISLLLFGFVFRLTAFMWLSGAMIIFLFMVITALLPIFALILDRNRKTKTIYNALIILVVFWFCLYAQKIITDKIEKSIELKAEVLKLKIEDYKHKYGIYPTSLDFEEFQNFNFTTSIGSKIIYNSYSDTTYTLKYSAFHGGEKSNGNYSSEWQWQD